MVKDSFTYGVISAFWSCVNSDVQEKACGKSLEIEGFFLRRLMADGRLDQGCGASTIV
jgi:hypothetical protein